MEVYLFANPLALFLIDPPFLFSHRPFLPADRIGAKVSYYALPAQRSFPTDGSGLLKGSRKGASPLLAFSLFLDRDEI